MKTSRILSLFAATAFVANFAFAHDDEGKEGKDHPCHKIKEACEAAGFKVGDHKDGKGLHKDCMHPIMEGQIVAGVTVSADEVAACKAKRGEHHKHHEEKEEHKG